MLTFFCFFVGYQECPNISSSFFSVYHENSGCVVPICLSSGSLIFFPFRLRWALSLRFRTFSFFHPYASSRLQYSESFLLHEQLEKRYEITTIIETAFIYFLSHLYIYIYIFSIGANKGEVCAREYVWRYLLFLFPKILSAERGGMGKKRGRRVSD